MKFNAVVVLTSLLGSAIAAPTTQPQHRRDVSVSADSPFAAALAARELLSLSEREEAAAAVEAADKDKIVHLNLGGDGKLLTLFVKGLLNINVKKRQGVEGLMSMGKTAVPADESQRSDHSARGLPENVFEIVGVANNDGRIGKLLDGLLGTLGLGGDVLTSITKQVTGDKGIVGGLLDKLLGDGKPAALNFTSQLRKQVVAGTLSEQEVVQALENAINLAYNAAPDASTKQSIESVVKQAMAPNAVAPAT
jgi:hypothetical protein